MPNPRLIEIAKRLGRTDLPIPPIEEETASSTAGSFSLGFSLEDKLNFWRFSNINYKNGIYQVDLAKSLLDNGNSKTQDEWIEYSRQAQRNNDFYLADFPLYFAVKLSLYENRNHSKYKDKIQEAKEFIKKNMFDYWLMTSTRVQYKKQGKDTIIHDYGLPDQYEIQENFVEIDGFIANPKTKAQPALNALLNLPTITPKEVNDVYKWLTEKDAYLIRVNSKSDTERVAWFGADSGWADLGCGGYPGGSYSSLGVKFAPQARAAKIR